MKKRNLFISLLFAFLMCFTFNISNVTKNAFADGETITITFNAAGGTCDPASVDITPGQTVSLPDPTYAGYIFTGWYNGETLVNGTETYDESTELVASYVRKIYKYSITKNVDVYEIKGQTQNSMVPYTLSTDSASVSDAIELISLDAETKTDETVIINFDGAELTENASISYDKVELSGSINLSTFSLNITPTKTDSVINLTDLELTSSSNQNLVNILGTNSATITISNVKFGASQKDNNYSLFLEHPQTMRFINTLSYSSEYLYNYELIGGNVNSQRNAIFDSSFVLEDTEKIAITIPYNVDNQAILTSRVGDKTMFEVFPNASNFTCSVKEKNANYLVVSTSFNLSFDPNGGTIENEFTNKTTNYKLLSELTFPTETNYTKTHQTLNGFISKLVLDSETVTKYSLSASTFYFDKTALTNFINAGSDYSTIETYFYTEIPNTTLDCFNYYKYDPSATDLNFVATDLMLKLNATPSFVAIWTDTQYKITLNNNDGNNVSEIEGLFGSAVTLPNPTRTGFSFVGWFDTLSKANTADPAEKLTISTMPDTNPTIYAGWSVISHTLTIHKNNQTANTQLTIDFGTSINSLSEVDPQNITKKGYTFVGWFTDEGFTAELSEDATMPNEDFDIYANWSINQYTITLYTKHPTIETEYSIYKTTTQNYNSDVREMFSTTPSYEGCTFNRWYTDEALRYPILTLPTTMPDENISLYSHITLNEYTLTIIHKVSGENGQILSEDSKPIYFNTDFTLSETEYSGYIFGGWYTNAELTEILSNQTMPSRNLTVYAKFIEKEILNPTLEAQSYSMSSKDGYKLPDNLEGFLVEYFVEGDWTTTAPTKKGSYDVRISKSEDSFYKSFIKTIENGYEITADPIDLSVWILIFYCLAGVEIICSIIVLLLRKQRKTYLTYALTLPIGMVQTSQFINFVISLVLAVFGFVLLMIQIVKLREVNNQIARVSTESEGYKPPDVSENESISKNVEILLEKEGFVSANKEPEIQKEIDDEDIFSQENEELENEPETDSNDYLSFDSDNDKDDSNF